MSAFFFAVVRCALGDCLHRMLWTRRRRFGKLRHENRHGRWVAMKGFGQSIVFVVCVACVADCSAQSSWSLKRWNLFNKSEPQYVEPIELTDEEPKSRWQNPFADLNLRPRPIEWRTPPFLKRMNENSTRMWRSTRRSVGHWASSTTSAIRNSTYDTWDAITRTTTNQRPAETDDPQQLAPSFGGVHDFLAKPKLKF